MSGVIVIPMKYTYYLVPIYPLLDEMNLDVARCLVNPMKYLLQSPKHDNLMWMWQDGW